MSEETQPNILSEKPQDVPEKFWDAEGGMIRTDALLKSYLALEQKLGGKEKEKEEARPAPPATPEEYVITLASDAIQNDPEVNRRLHAKGFTNEQVQEVYDLAAEKLVPQIMDIVYDAQADRELEKIIDHFGGVENWARIAKQLLAYGRKNLPADMLRTLAGSYDGILTLERMMRENRQMAPSEKGGKRPGGALDDKELTKMMQNPRYWRDRDPAYIAKVTEGFQQLYG